MYVTLKTANVITMQQHRCFVQLWRYRETIFESFCSGTRCRSGIPKHKVHGQHWATWESRRYRCESWTDCEILQKKHIRF